jgi:DNA-binding NtrC family response regulator
VLIVAEAGCRPLAVCESLHARTRGGRPFVAIDCSASEASEIDRQLFGAVPRNPLPQDLEALGSEAALMAAGDGTLFLENIEELPASAQRRLARILRDGEVRVASSDEPVAMPFRLIASASGAFDAEVQEGRFRQDLFRRLAASRITVAPLRQRGADVPAIIERLIAGSNGTSRSLTQPAVTVLAALPWSRNIDELAGVLTKVLETAGPTIRQEDVLMHLPIEGAFARFDLTASLREARRRFEREYIAAVLERHSWRMSEAARTLGIERANLYRKTRQLGITRISRAEVS